MAEYAERELSKGERLHAITRHMLGLVSHTPGSREYRRLLSEGAREKNAGPELIRKAAELALGGREVSGGREALGAREDLDATARSAASALTGTGS
jgi:hypothetical protein